MKNFKNFVIAALCVVGLSMSMTAQTSLPAKGYYLGVSTGASMGTCTFRSFSDNGKTARAEFGLSAGYRFSNLFSLELNGVRGNVEMTPMNCCAEEFIGIDFSSSIPAEQYNPANAYNTWSKSNLTTETKFARFSLQGNFNILYIFKNLRESRWKLDLSPMIGGVQTHTTAYGLLMSGEYHEKEFTSQWHFTCGGQASVGVALNKNIELRMYAGVNFLSGDRFDNLPGEQHTENLMYDGGAKLSWNFGNRCAGKAAAVAEKETPATDLSGVEERLETIQNEIVRMREEAEKVEQGQPVQSVNAGDAAIYSVVFGRYPFSVFFDLNSAELRSDNDRVNLKTFADFAKKYGCMIRLRGTCDEATGSANYNQALSESRCNTVKDELVKLGMNANDIVIEAAGGVSEFENIESNRRVYLDFVK